MSTDVDLRDILAGFDALERVLDRHGRPLFTEVQRDIKADMRAQKAERRGVLGGPWPPRAPATRERAQRASKSKRRKSASAGLLGRIPTAWTGRADADGLEMDNAVPFAAAHHEGARVGRGAQLPARPHLDVDPERVDDLAEAIVKLAVDAWENRR